MANHDIIIRHFGKRHVGTQPAAPLLVFLLAACTSPLAPAEYTVPPATPSQRVGATLRVIPHASPICGAAFVTHTLPHTTVADTRIPALYAANGAGLAVGDLDADGDEDLVLANIGGPNRVLWNTGGLQFVSQDLDGGDSRAVVLIDEDIDGDLDIVATNRFQKPSIWRNQGERRFVRETLPDVNNALYVQTWLDVDGDDRLDLIAASYDTEQRQREGLIFTQRGDGIGVFVYTRAGTTYRSQQLADKSEALAIITPDINGDGRRDLWIGNDFSMHDGLWLRSAQGWAAAPPPETITENTMSLDAGDIDNDGQLEIFASDMKPEKKDPALMAQWLPIMKRMTRPLTSADPQFPENTLLVRDERGRWENEGYNRKVDATGWSWSSKFGDLDGDGFLDLYIVNGMIAEGLISHLPNHELVEANVAFQNDGRGGFTRVPAWGLGSLASGRGMSMADLDDDGDLDVVVNNMASPAQVFENQLCSNQHLTVDLRQPGGNPRAIGATLELHTSAGIQTREVRVQSGYLSGDSARTHFGLPQGATITALLVIWPDGSISEMTEIAPTTRVTVTRTAP